MLNRQSLKYWLPVVAWMMIIYCGSTDLLSAANTSNFLVPLLRWLYRGITDLGLWHAQFLIRKTGHLSEYAVLMILMWRAVDRFGPNVPFTWRWNKALFALLLTVAYAATDEFHQSFYASRTGSVRDVFIDSCGALIGLMLVWAIVTWRKEPAFFRARSGN